MANHTKPTNEELEEQIQKSIEGLEEEEKQDQEIEDKAEELENDDEIEEEVDDQEDEEEVDEEDENDEEDESGDDGRENLKQEIEKKPAKKEDYEKRYKDSSREATILYNKNKKMADAIEKAGDVKPPTEEELKAEYSDWDTMTDFEQKMAKSDMTNTRKLEAISEATKEFKEMDAWNGKVDEFMADPETIVDFPELEGKEEEFKLFVSKPTRIGADFDILVDSFLYNASKSVKKKTGKMFPTGKGGHQKKPSKNSNKLSVSESIRLRTTNYKKYLELLKKGKISSQV